MSSPLLNDLVSIWRVHLLDFLREEARFFSGLDDAEKKRADSFKFERDRNRFIISHGALRMILARALKRAPKEIFFRYNRYQKPFLKQNNAERPWYFNLSHSGDYALVAVHQGTPIGVDIEEKRSISHEADIIRRFFSAREAREYAQLPDHQKQDAFYQGWTSKEAFIKARGQGVFCSLQSFDVSLMPTQPLQLLAIEDNSEKAKHWQLHRLNVPENYLAAVAWYGEPKKIESFEFKKFISAIKV